MLTVLLYCRLLVFRIASNKSTEIKTPFLGLVLVILT